MNRKLSSLAVLTVVVSIFAMITVAFATPDVAYPAASSQVAIPWDVTIGDSVTLTASNTTGEVQWYKNTSSHTSNGTAILDATNATYTVDTSAAGTTYYYVEDNTGASVALKVVVHEAVIAPAVIKFGDYNDKNLFLWSHRSSESSLIQDGGKTVLKLQADGVDPNVTLYNLGVDIQPRPYFVAKVKSFDKDGVGDRLKFYHYFSTPDGKIMDDAGESDSNKWFVQASLTNAPSTGDPEWTYLEKASPSGQPFVPNNAVNITGGRFDFFDDCVSQDISDNYMYVEYIGYFESKEQFDKYVADGEKFKQPYGNTKTWNFVDDVTSTADFFGVDESTLTPGQGITLLADNGENATYLMTREKFDLSEFSAVKFYYDADANTTVTFRDGGKTFTMQLPADQSSAVFDFTNNQEWSDKFSALTIEVSNDITLESIVFFNTAREANSHEFVSNPPVEGETSVDYQDAIWWDFADTHMLYNVQPLNAIGQYSSTEARVNYTAKADGDVSLTYNPNGSARQFEASQYPFVEIGLDGTYAGTEAFVRFSTDAYDYSEPPFVINFTIPESNKNVEGADNTATKPFLVDLSSLAAIKRLDANYEGGEFVGNIQSFEIGFKDAAEGDVIAMEYIAFFETKTASRNFNGSVPTDPDVINKASWKSKEVLKNDYVTVDDLDLSADEVVFDMNDFARISRMALNELKRDYPTKTINVVGDGFKYVFRPANVKNNLRTWYYDLDVRDEKGFSGDIYRDVIKSLVTEGKYVAGIHFVQKFLKDTSFPFDGKFIYEVGSEYEGKYLTIYKYNVADKALDLVEYAVVSDGKISTSSLGGDIVIVDEDYQPSSEEIARLEAIKVFEETPWNAIIFDYSKGADASLVFAANNAKIETLSEGNVTFKRATSTTPSLRIEATFSPTPSFEASEYPVVVTKYRTSTKMSGSVDNYVITSFYADTAESPNYNGYKYFRTGAWYALSSVFTKNTDWNTKIIDYTNKSTMVASGIPVNSDHFEGGGDNLSSHAAYPFKGSLYTYRLDFNVGSIGTYVDFAYVAFFKTEEEARKYVEARDIVESYAAQQEENA